MCVIRALAEPDLGPAPSLHAPRLLRRFHQYFGIADSGKTTVAIPGDSCDLVWRVPAEESIEGSSGGVCQQACGRPTKDLLFDLVAAGRNLVPSRRQYPPETHEGERRSWTDHDVTRAWRQAGILLRVK